MRNEQTAITITPPTGSDQVNPNTGALDAGRGQAFPFTTSSSGVITLTGEWGTFTADQSCQIRFWSDSSLGPVVAADFPIWQFSYLPLVIENFLFCRVKGMTASGNLYFYPSSR